MDSLMDFPFLNSEGFTNVAFLSSVLFFSYFGVGGLFLIIDLTHKPQWIFKYKIQPIEKYTVTKQDVKKVIRQLLINAFLVHQPFMIGYYYLQKWRGCDLSLTLPPISTLLAHLAASALIEEIIFYYGHRFLHWGPMYKYVHKQHHEFTAPFGLVSAYAHPVEFMTSNLATVMSPPVILGSDVITTAILLSISVVVTVIHHSGYHLPLLPSPEFHDYHHLKFVGNYGVLGILDKLHGTDTTFRKSKNFKKDRVIWSFKQLTNLGKYN